MGQGSMFSYVTGTEYRDIMDAWDWDLVPGTTVLLNKPRHDAKLVGVQGKTTFVGGVSDGWVGTAVEDYVEPHDASVSYKKAWFFLDDSVLVTTSKVELNSSVAGVEGTPVITVLDNRAAVDGGVWVDGEKVDASGGAAVNGSTLFYGGNGYLSYDSPFSLTLWEGPRAGNWSAISTSTLGNTTVGIFSAHTTVPHDAYTYVFFPASDADRLSKEQKAPTTTVVSGEGIMGAAGGERLGLVFWPGSEPSITVDTATIGWGDEGSVTFTSDQPAAYLFATRRNEDGTRSLAITVADPSQSATSASFTMTVDGATVRCENNDHDDGCEETQGGVSFTVDLPSGGYAGSSVSRGVMLA